jgi:hypothetical protein
MNNIKNSKQYTITQAFTLLGTVYARHTRPVAFYMNYFHLICFRHSPNVCCHSGLALQSDKQNGTVDVPEATSNTPILRKKHYVLLKYLKI